MTHPNLIRIQPIYEKTLGIKLTEDTLKYFRFREEDDFILWTKARINIPILLIAETPIVIRHNEPEELFTLEVGGIPTISILGTKIAGEARRVMHQILRTSYKLFGNEIDNVIAEYSKTHGCDNVKPYNGLYHCNVATEKITMKKTKTEEIAVSGACKQCPACMLFGYAVEGESEPNIISRIYKDTFYAIRDVRLTSTTIRRNAVDSITYRTGTSLFEINAGKPGTVFVGVISLKDVTPWEALLVLKVFTELENIGAIKTIFGTIRTVIPAINFRYGRALTGYEIAKDLLREKEVTLEQVIDHITSKLEVAGDITYKGMFDDALRSLKITDMKEIILEAWKDAIHRRCSIMSYLAKKQK